MDVICCGKLDNVPVHRDVLELLTVWNCKCTNVLQYWRVLKCILLTQLFGTLSLSTE